MDVFIRDSPQKSRVILIVTVIHLEVVKAVDLEAAGSGRCVRSPLS
jgi:hypothetical protein